MFLIKLKVTEKRLLKKQNNQSLIQFASVSDQCQLESDADMTQLCIIKYSYSMQAPTPELSNIHSDSILANISRIN